MKRLFSKRKILKAFAAFTLTLCLAACTNEGYLAVKMVSSNTSEGWECTFGSLDGDYTNTFPINGSKLKITSETSSGEMTVTVENVKSSYTFDGKNASEVIDMADFGTGSVYITFSAENAENGSMSVVWLE
ncbi:MAG: hypothetical protein ACI4JJ_09150 [Huintestinicola sp.]